MPRPTLTTPTNDGGAVVILLLHHPPQEGKEDEGGEVAAGSGRTSRLSGMAGIGERMLGRRSSAGRRGSKGRGGRRGSTAASAIAYSLGLKREEAMAAVVARARAEAAELVECSFGDSATWSRIQTC